MGLDSGAAKASAGARQRSMPSELQTSARHICIPCKRKFPSVSTLQRHEQRSDIHRKILERREDKMTKRKKELIMAARSIRQQIVEAEEALQSQAVVNETVQHQKILLEMQLQQLLGEYGQAQEIVELAREAREARLAGVDRPLRTREVRVGKLALTAGVASWQSNKDVQEDRYVLDIEVESPEGHLIAGFAVLDGHSGSMCVDHVVEHLQGALQRCLSAKPKLSDEHLTQAVLEACLLTDEDFLKKARVHEVLDGSTLVLALVYPQVEPPAADETRRPGCCRLLVACVGDSRAVLCRADGGAPGSGQQLAAVPLSEDHKPNLPGEMDRITRAGGSVERRQVGPIVHFRVNGNLNLSRSIGDLEYKKNPCLSPPEQMICATPDVQTFKREPSDEFLILACDGVWDVLGNQEAIDFVHERLPEWLSAGRPLSGIMEEMLDHCVSPDLALTNGLGGDNMTAMLVVFDQASLAGRARAGSEPMTDGASPTPINTLATIEERGIQPAGLCSCRPDLPE
mmetsp:Transcript_87019/g.254646  ORF Transcript_87019/g.254646 Transcript_87019/m.254646 type:complete len:514 (+) Transcript_87019:124-1665(+)